MRAGYGDMLKDGRREVEMGNEPRLPVGRDSHFGL